MILTIWLTISYVVVYTMGILIGRASVRIDKHSDTDIYHDKSLNGGQLRYLEIEGKQYDIYTGKKLS